MRISIQIVERAGDCLVDHAHVAVEGLAHFGAPARLVDFDPLVPVVDHLASLEDAIVEVVVV